MPLLQRELQLGFHIRARHLWLEQQILAPFVEEINGVLVLDETRVLVGGIGQDRETRPGSHQRIEILTNVEERKRLMLTNGEVSLKLFHNLFRTLDLFPDCMWLKTAHMHHAFRTQIFTEQVVAQNQQVWRLC